MTAPALKISDLAKSVPGGRLLFADLDLDVAAGEQVAVRGESGVGKSTLLNMVAGLDAPDRGTIEIVGAALGALDEDQRSDLRRDRVGFVFQAFHILPHLTLAQNVGLPLLLQKKARVEALERAGGLLDAVGLGDRRRSYPKELSGGELQRVAIARALVHKPSLLLGRAVKEQGAAMLLVTHSPAAAAVADRQLLLTRSGLAAA